MTLGFAVVGAIFVFVGVFTNSWWNGPALMGAEVNVGLRSVEVCGLGACRELSWNLVGGRGFVFGVFAWLTYLAGFAAAGLLLVGAYFREFQDVDVFSKAGTSVCFLLIPLSVVTVFSFPGRGLSLGYGFWLTIGGAVLGVASRLQGFGRSGWDGGSHVPVKVPEAKATRTAGLDPYRSPAQLDVDDKPKPSAEPTHRMEYTRKVVQASSHEAPHRVGVGRLQQRVSAVKPAAVDSLGDTLRFVAKSCELTSAGMFVQLKRGELHVRWADVQRIVVRKLPADPPFAHTIFVDIVLGSVGHPVRLLPSTHVNYTDLPGAGTTSTENFRRLGAYLNSNLSDVLEPESVPFFLEGKQPPAFQAVRQFADYDSQYGG